MYETARQLISNAKSITIIQAENPDGDSLGSAIALEEVLGDLGYQTSLYCQINIPRYLHYIQGWDRVVDSFDFSADLAIIVDTNSENLLTKTLTNPAIRNFLETHPVLVFDHHVTEPTLSFEATIVYQPAVATAELLTKFFEDSGWQINPVAAECLTASIMSDSLGLASQSTTVDSVEVIARLARLGAKISDIEQRRREYMRKSAEILAYKGELIGRIEYLLDGRLALVHITWDDIRQYSDQYNPSVLVLSEMLLVDDVEVACAIKTYPDGKLTGKIQCNTPVADQIAGYFGGGGHAYAAGFKVYEQYDQTIQELTTVVDRALNEASQ